MKPTQLQMYEAARRQNAAINAQFLEMASGPNAITNDELKILIRKRPALWGRFANYIGKLPLGGES